MTVHFIGAGPGAADLITVRGGELLARCPVCLYAGSLVPRALRIEIPERIGADEKAMSTRTGRPLTDKWTFSTNGVSIQGRYGIPCVGFGPGAESQAHAPNEITWKQDLVTCAALYAAVPMLYKPENKESVTEFRQELTGNDIK